jgi:hypothetical protein
MGDQSEASRNIETDKVQPTMHSLENFLEYVEGEASAARSSTPVHLRSDYRHIPHQAKGCIAKVVQMNDQWEESST